MGAEGGREPVRSYDRSWSEIEEMLDKAIARSGKSGSTSVAKTATETV